MKLIHLCTALAQCVANPKMTTLDAKIGPVKNLEHIKTKYPNQTDAMSLTGAPIVKDLTDLQDVQIVATVYIGSNQQPFEMIFDTGSNWLWVDSDQCANCPHGMPKFQDDESTTYE